MAQRQVQPRKDALEPDLLAGTEPQEGAMDRVLLIQEL